MTPSLFPGLYAIADTAFGDPLAQGFALAEGGARTIQLRAKDWSTAQRARAGRALVEHLADRGVRIVMNDDLEAAVQAGVHGLHLGQDDGSLAQARARLGPSALLGRSTHSIEQVFGTEPEADYIGFGPVFTTSTKRSAGAARGIELLSRAVRSSCVPVVAIGGIDRTNLRSVQDAGARHWAVISDLLTAPDIAARAVLLGSRTDPTPP